MTKKELIEATIEKEWNMFHWVNGEVRADCQEDWRTFVIMRRAQYMAWSEEAVASFFNDICTAEAEGRNLSREKYIRMMKSTDPVTYEVFSKELPEVSEHKQALVDELWEKILAQTVRMRKKYPILAMGGRPTYASEEQGWASLETYQTSESLTYSEKTLEALLAHCSALEEQGIDLAFEIQKNTVTGLGFENMDQAEAAMAKRLMQLAGKGNGCCSSAGNPDGF